VLIAGKRGQRLIEQSVPDVPLMLPGVADWKLRSGYVDDVMIIFE